MYFLLAGSTSWQLYARPDVSKKRAAFKVRRHACLVAVVCVLAAAADLHIFSSLAIASQPTCKRTRFSLSLPFLLYNVLCAVAVLCSFAVFAIFLCSVAMQSWLSSLRHVFARCVRAGRTCDALKAIAKSSFPFAFCNTHAHLTKNRSQP